MAQPSVKRSIIRHSAAYGLGNLLSRFASILLLPLYTRMLSPSDYGVIAICDVTAVFIALYGGIGVGHAAARFHFDEDFERADVWWTALLIQTIAGITLTTLFISATFLAQNLIGQSNIPMLLRTAAIGVCVQLIGSVPEKHLVITKRSTIYSVLQLGRLILNIALNVTFVVVYELGAFGVILGNAIATFIMASTTFFIFCRTYPRFSIKLHIAKKMIRFGIPLMGTSSFMLLSGHADIIVLKIFTDFDTVGKYSLAAKLASAMQLLLTPFGMVWAPLAIEISQRSDADKVYRNVFLVVSFGLTIVALGLGLLARPFILIFATEDYLGAAPIVPWLAWAVVFQSLHLHIKTPALVAKRTASMLPTAATSAFVTLGLAFLLVPYWGEMGGAISKTLGALSFSVVGFFIYRRIEDHQFPFKKVTFGVGLSIMAYLLLESMHRFLNSNIVYGIGLFICTSALFYLLHHYFDIKTLLQRLGKMGADD